MAIDQTSKNVRTMNCCFLLVKFQILSNNAEIWRYTSDEINRSEMPVGREMTSWTSYAKIELAG